jgi:sporulation protein YlmC with PRC-barrel domain
MRSLLRLSLRESSANAADSPCDRVLTQSDYRGDDAGALCVAVVMRLELGDAIYGADGVWGELTDLVIDPTTQRVTHLVVAPKHRHDLARLVPVEKAHAGSSSDNQVVLDYTSAEMSELELVQKSAYLRLGELPVEDPDWEVGVIDMLALPYYGSLASGGLDTPIEPLGVDEHVTEIYDRVPKDKVEIRRSSSVFSGDEHLIGHVDGFVVGSDELISHVVLERGHLWGKKDVTIPINAVAGIDNDEVRLNLSRDEVGELSSVPVRRWAGLRG